MVEIIFIVAALVVSITRGYLWGHEDGRTLGERP
jgi:hypothetical protein